MSSQTKIQEEIKPEVHDLAIKSRITGMDLINCLLYLKLKLKKLDEISMLRRLKMNKKDKRIRNRKN